MVLVSEAGTHRGRTKVKVNASMPKKKTKRESDKELLANVTREMAEPRVAQSARTEACKQDRIVDSK
jgi:hypothetical protein